MALQRRTIDRAQRIRARRVWWERNGAFTRGMVTGVLVTLVAIWVAQAVIGASIQFNP
jgi:hypothetical protein